MNAPTAESRMADYYARRAAEYERLYAKPERQADLGAMQAWLAPIFAGRRVLEIACGTGWWTLHGAGVAARWLATDLNPETLAIARAKPTMPGVVEFRAMDAYRFAGLGDEGFDAAFAGFWWSHVPRARLGAWLDALHSRLAPGAVVVLLDNRYVEGSSTPLARRDADGNTYQVRRLDDGSAHEVLKNFPSQDEAVAVIGEHTGDAQWVEWPHYWALHYRLGQR
jgi:SAM-dependent methyltransferase